MRGSTGDADQATRPWVVELFSGTGAATRPWEEAGYRVVRVDFNDTFKPTLLADVAALPLRAGCRPAFLWASPPCEGYSTANPRRDRDPRLWDAARDAIRRLGAERWVIENVRGACRVHGIPAARWGPWYLWANFRVRLPVARPLPKMRFDNPRTRKILRAAIPPELARAVYASWRDDLRER